MSGQMNSGEGDPRNWLGVSGRDANQLAADVRTRHNEAVTALAADVHPFSAQAIRDNEAEMDIALAELVALVGTLQQERDDALDWNWRREGMRPDSPPEQKIAYLCDRFDGHQRVIHEQQVGWMDEIGRRRKWSLRAWRFRGRAEAAEAALAEERAARIPVGMVADDEWKYTEEAVVDAHALCCNRCKADREALATTRQALTEAEELLVRLDMNGCKNIDDPAELHAARRAEKQWALDARILISRALADTGGDTKENA